MQSQPPRSPTNPDPFPSSHSRWLALTHRAPCSHSSFLYGVTSTKIYCRPTCSARLARRANVVFYDTAAQARRDGFRPCKRCKPDDATFVGEAEEVVSRAIALLRTKKDDGAMKRGLRMLAKEVGVSPSYLCRVFKRTVGLTVGAYMREFEREAGEGEAESEVESPGTGGSGLGDGETGLLTPARSLSAPFEGLERGSAEEDMGTYVEEALDLDSDFNDWCWTADFMTDSIYGVTI
ncbi:hypothetical protein MMC17_006674 [Xylographa soralifera]|nr:hypothetical protein [Xylographa soralifera]